MYFVWKTPPPLSANRSSHFSMTLRDYTTHTLCILFFMLRPKSIQIIATPQNPTATGLIFPLNKYRRQQKQPVLFTSNLENTLIHYLAVCIIQIFLQQTEFQRCIIYRLSATEPE